MVPNDRKRNDYERLPSLRAVALRQLLRLAQDVEDLLPVDEPSSIGVGIRCILAEMRALLDAATHVSGPLTLLAFLSVVALLVYRRSVRDRRGLEYVYRLLASKLTREHFYLLANRVITAFLILVLSIFALALAAWLFDRHFRQASEPDRSHTPKVRFTYFTIGGHAVTDFVEGRLPKGWQPAIAADAVIVRNDVYTTLRRWTSRYPGYVEGSLYPSVGFAPLPVDYTPTPFVGSHHTDILKDSSLGELQALLRNGHSWNAVVNVGLDTTMFWRLATRADIERFRDAAPDWFDFYRAMLPLVPPSDFALLYNYQEECGAVPRLFLETRVVSVRTLVIENISPTVLDVGAFKLFEASSTGFRKDEEDEHPSRALYLSLYPRRYLKPGERIVVPEQITFVFDQSDWFLATMQERVPQPLSLWKTRSHRHGPEDLSVEVANFQHITLPLKQLQEMAERHDDELLDHDYIAGPAIDVTEVQVDGKSMAVRPRDTKNVTIEGRIEEGSCPFAFTRSTEGEAWANEGRILRNRRGQDMSGIDERQLSHFDGTILLRELEPEHSFVDEVFVRVLTPQKQRLLLLPEDQRLRSADQDAVRIDRRHDLLVRFDIRNVPPGSVFVLHARGYYEGD